MRNFSYKVWQTYLQRQSACSSLWELKTIINIYNKKNMKKSINEKEQCVQTDVMQSVLLTEKDLIDLGFEIVRFKEPNYNIGIDRFWKLDYAIMRINQKIGNGDDLVIRFREGKFVLDGFYGVRFYKKQDILDLISCFTRSSQTVA